MWLNDVKRLTALLYDRGYTDLVMEKIIPAHDGIAIYTTYHTVLYVHHNGFIQEFEREDMGK
jgi:hypothetical protein